MRLLQTSTTFGAVVLLVALLSACSAAGLSGRILLAGPEGADDPERLDGKTVSGVIDVQFEPVDTFVFEQVRFRVNGAEAWEPLVHNADGSLQASIDTALLFDGEHVVSVLAYDEDGDKLPGEVRSRFTVQNGGTEHEDRMPRADGLVLEADPGFRPPLLSRELRIWYDRLWSGISRVPDEIASSGDLRDYGYSLQQHMALLAAALRATGDLRILDEMARLAELMSDALVTQWYVPSSSSWIEPDDGTAGYRRFVLRRETGDQFAGKDTQVLSSVLAHGTIAHMAFVFDVNRDRPSPGGYDYGEVADFWTQYLKEDFEAIWRLRTEREWPSLPLWNHPVAHAWKSVMRWSYYMFRLTGEQPYLDSAQDFARSARGNTFATESPSGPALVWSHVLIDPRYGLQPVAYARYEYAIEAELAMEGGLDGIDAEYMAKHARSLAHFVLDNGTADLAFDIGGMRPRTGVSLVSAEQVTIPTKDPWTDSGLRYRRESFDRYFMSYLAPIGMFAERERIASISERAYLEKIGPQGDADAIAVPAAMLLLLNTP